MKNDIGQHYMCNYCPKLEKLNPWPPKPLNIGIRQSFKSSGSIQSKKNRSTTTLLLPNVAKIAKSNVAVERFIFGLWMDPLLLKYCPIPIFSGSGSIKLNIYSVDLCNFSWFLAQLSPLASQKLAAAVITTSWQCPSIFCSSGKNVSNLFMGRAVYAGQCF